MDFKGSPVITIANLLICISTTVAQRCPQRCTCDGPRVSCTDTNLDHVPVGIPIATTYLDFSNNSLATIRNQTQLHNLPSLRELYMRENRIRTIEAGSFWGHENLTRLDLSFNRLTILDRYTFGGLGDLKTLNLDNNPRLCLDFGSLGNLPALLKLTLGKTPVNFVPGLFEVSPSHVAASVGLQELLLWNTGMVLVPYDALMHLPSIWRLDLSRNRIECLPNSAFVRNTNLTHLDLSLNPIAVVQRGAFEGLLRLSVLLLDDTNTLSMIPKGVFDPAPSSLQVCLFGNPWRCDCHLKWLKAWMEDPARVHCGHKPSCHSPPNLEGNPLYYIPDELLICDGSIASLPDVECHSNVLYTDGYCKELLPMTPGPTTAPVTSLGDNKQRRKSKKERNGPPSNHRGGPSALLISGIAVGLLVVAVVGSVALRQLRVRKKLHDQKQYFNISYENGEQQLRMADNPYKETETFY